MKDELWKRVKRALMCLLSRSFDAVCLWKAYLSMTNRFPQSLQSAAQSHMRRVSVKEKMHDKEIEQGAPWAIVCLTG